MEHEKKFELPRMWALFVQSNTLELHPKIASTSCEPAFNHKRPGLAPYLASTSDVARHIWALSLSSHDNRRKKKINSGHWLTVHRLSGILHVLKASRQTSAMSKHLLCSYIISGLVNLFFDQFIWTHFWNFYDGWLHLGKFFRLLCCENMGVENMLGWGFREKCY